MAKIILSKICEKCSDEYPVSDYRFYVKKNGEISYRRQCRNCDRLDCASRRGRTEITSAKIERDKFLAIYIDLKYCAKGDHYPHRSQFIKCESRPDGLSVTCRDCRRKFRQENFDKIRTAKKRYRTENHDKVLLGVKSAHQKYGDKYRERNRIKRITNPEYFQEQARRYYTKNPDKVKQNSKFQGIKRRARKATAPGYYTPAQWEQKLAFHGYRCYLCGLTAEKLEQDHRIPISRGGTNWLANVAPACKTCNRSKNCKTEKEYRERFMLAESAGRW